MTEVPHRSGDERRPLGTDTPGTQSAGGAMPQAPGAAPVPQTAGGTPQGSGGQLPYTAPGQAGQTGATQTGHVTQTGQSPVGGQAAAAERGRTAGVESGAARSAKASHSSPLLAHSEADKLSARLQHAVSGFVDGPRAAVEEADQVLEEIANRFTDAVTQRRRTLRHSWQETDEATPGTTDTEQLRLALRDYRELADRLLHH
ncbi:hypothetical protein ACWC10_00755 [Streptomyces sp. NPDC001595]|uniref:hypothetical protein n=1 Tax=Streptomyces sp. NPDC001532 TaxID=3154520 RepID=UPI00332BAB9E